MTWKIILPLSTLITLAYSGGRTLSAQESAQFLNLFRRYCGNPGAGPQQDGNTFYYCKTADQGPIRVSLDHNTEIQPGDTPKQVIFVQPPSYQYTHNVALSGSPGNPQQTEIYVLPGTANHELQLQDQRSSIQAVKPSLYFLSDQQQRDQRPGNTAGQPRPLAAANSDASVAVGSSRPSAPPPNPSNPNAIGIDVPFSTQRQQPQQLGGYSQAYGAPSALSPRNQRNLKPSQFRYTTL